LSSSILKPIVIIGGGGHASVLVDILRSQNRKILTVICPDEINARPVFSGIAHHKNDDEIFKYKPENVLLVNGVGMLPKSNMRRKLNQYFLSHGYKFETVISNGARISQFALIEEGAQVFAGAVIQVGAIVGSHSIINSSTLIEHDCTIGNYNHIAPRATLCGQVTTQDDVFVGAGATIIQNIRLEEGSVVGAGALVTKNLFKNEVCYPSRSDVKYN